jgi:hypothetical protein
MPTTPPVRCHFCQTLVDPNALGVYKRVTGWARNRKSGTGGTHQLALPGPVTGYACAPCIDIQAGRGPNTSPTLF